MWRKSINLITWGGLGDALLATPALKALKEKYPEKKIRVFAHKRHFEILRNNPYIDSLLGTSFKSAPVYWLLSRLALIKIKSLNYSFSYPAENESRKAAEIIGDLLGVVLKDKRMNMYLTDGELLRGKIAISGFNNPIVINPNAVCFTYKEWSYEKWEELIGKLPNYTFIQLGKKNERLLKGAVNLTGLPLRDSVAIVKSSLCYVGVDSFLAHAAASVCTPSVVLFGPSSPVVFGNEGNINIQKELPCSPCIDMLIGSRCPYKGECMRQITVQEVKGAILKQLNKTGLAASFSMEMSDEF